MVSEIIKVQEPIECITILVLKKCRKFTKSGGEFGRFEVLIGHVLYPYVVFGNVFSGRLTFEVAENNQCDKGVSGLFSATFAG